MIKPLISVVMITYKHATFIEQAVCSVLAQKGNFDLQLIIADDHSPDQTADIIKKIIAQHPKAKAIEYLRNETNLGVMKNAFQALAKVKGEYLALCEGDDYWLDNTKLEQQVNFLSKNKDFAVCFHNTRIEKHENPDDFFLLNENLTRNTFELQDLIGEDEIWFMATASLVFRTDSILPLPSWLQDSRSGDIPMLILAARKGKIRYLKDTMAAYRKHEGGVSLTDHKNRAFFLENRIFMYDQLNRETDYVFNKTLKRNIARYYYMLLNSIEYKDQYFKKIPFILKYLSYTFPKVPNLKPLIKDHLIPSIILNFSRKLKKLLGIIPS